MLYLKSCPRCHGDLYLDRDTHGPFRQCLQCGWIQDLREAAPAPLSGLRAGSASTSRPAAASVAKRSSGKVAVA